MSIKTHTGMTVVLTRSILALLATAIKIVLNTPFAVTRLTYYWFDALERGNDQRTTQTMCNRGSVCLHISGNIILSVACQPWSSEP